MWIALLVAGLVAFPAAPTPAQVRGELRVGVAALPTSLDPATALEGPIPFLARQVFDTLVQFREGTSDVEPALATHWTVSRDGLTWTFVLRSGVGFHDGTPLTAPIVATSFERQMFPEHPQHPSPNEGWPRLLRGVPGIVRQVQALDDRRLRIDLVQPYAPLLTVLAHPVFSVTLATADETGATRQVGTGPYRIGELAPGRIVLEAHPGHWAGSPRVQRIVVVEVAGDEQAEPAFDAKSLDLWLPARPPRRKVGALSVPGWQIGLLAMQTEKPPFTAKKVRQAIAAALDPALLRVAIEDSAVPLQSFLPPGVWGRREGPPILSASPMDARRLLGEAGYPTGIAVRLVVGESSGALDYGRLADAIHLALDRARIAVSIRTEPPLVVSQITQNGDHELAVAEARAEAGDPHFLLYPLSTSEGAVRGERASNLSFYRNPRLDDLLIRASQLAFRPERLRLYQRAQGILADELPWLPLFVRLHWVVARPAVKNLRLHPSGFHRLDRVELAESP